MFTLVLFSSVPHFFDCAYFSARLFFFTSLFSIVNHFSLLTFISYHKTEYYFLRYFHFSKRIFPFCTKKKLLLGIVAIIFFPKLIHSWFVFFIFFAIIIIIIIIVRQSTCYFFLYNCKKYPVSYILYNVSCNSLLVLVSARFYYLLRAIYRFIFNPLVCVCVCVCFYFKYLTTTNKCIVIPFLCNTRLNIKILRLFFFFFFTLI